MASSVDPVPPTQPHDDDACGRPPPNRGRSWGDLPPTTVLVGVDTIRVVGEIKPVVGWVGFDVRGQRPLDQRWTATSGQAWLGGGVRLAVRDQQDRWQATIEYSAPRYTNGNNLHSLPTAATVRSACDLYDQAASFVNWMVPPDQLKVCRLDSVRDFHDPSGMVRTLIDAHRDLPVRYHPKVAAYTDQHGYPSLYRIAPGRWATRLYCKEGEILSRAAKVGPGPERQTLLALAEQAVGQVRFEVQARRRVLVERHVDVLEAVTASAVVAMNQQYFNRAGLDREVGGMDKIRVANMQAEGKDKRAFPKALGVLLCDALGIKPEGDRKTLAEHRKVAARLGLSAADLASVTERTSSLRLDYQAGVLLDGRTS